MVEFNFKPNYFFSFSDWSYGYIFQQLYQLSKIEYGNSFYFFQNNELLFVSTKFKQIKTKEKEDNLHFTLEFYTQNQNNELIHLENPSEEILKIAKETIIDYLGVGEDLTEFYKFANQFEELESLKNILPGYRLSSVLMRDWMPVLGFLSTNTSVEMYHTFLINFLEHWGIKVKLDHSVIPSFPPLHHLKGLQDQDYRKTKIGYRSKYMPEIVNKIISKELPLDNLESLLADEDKKNLLKKLQSAKGIGDYTARGILLYGLRDYSVGFVDSFIKIIMNKYFNTDRKIANKELMKKIDEIFYPYQGLMIDWLTAIYSKTNNTSKDKYFILK